MVPGSAARLKCRRHRPLGDHLRHRADRRRDRDRAPAGPRLQIQPLAAAGFRVVASDTRGYNLSSKPEGFEAYGVDLLAADIRGLVRGLDAGSALYANPPYTPQEIKRYVEA
jgi:pimeloyl-ACP methyl ester carboxylesterase